MNIIEAVRSGKPFTRDFPTCWFEPHKHWQFTEDDVLADDWQIKEEKLELTESKVREVLDSLYYAEGGGYDFEFNDFLKQLGFTVEE